MESASKRDRIVDLFGQSFVSTDPNRWGHPAEFHCPYEAQCNVNRKEEPIWSAAIGDEDSEVMIVAEAPGNALGKGPHIGGYFEEWTSHKSPVCALRDFVKKHYDGKTPYFTDAVKCGVERQRSKQVLQVRLNNCVERFLLKEIAIIEPKTILCVGRFASSVLDEWKKLRKIDRHIGIYYLLHYSRQANLPLKKEDKELVWKWEADLISPEEKENMPLTALSHFRRRHR